MTDIKQVIVMRTDLGMRKGKMIAQGAHASVSFLSQVFQECSGLEVDSFSGRKFYNYEGIYLTEAQFEWMTGNFKKICVRVDSEEELVRIHDEALAAKLTSHLIRDSGLTEFAGVPTLTCCAIGPNLSSEIDQITGGLTLL